MARGATKAALILASICALLLPSDRAHAQYPDRPIKFIVGLPPGGLIDNVARVFAEKMSSILGKPIVIENRPGAMGRIAEEFAARSDADGYTLMIGDVSRPVLMRAETGGNVDLDMLKSFDIIGEFGSTPLLLSMTTKLGVKDFPSLIAKLKAEPGKNYSYASIGAASSSPSPIISNMLVRMIGLDVVMVPYRGGSEALTDVIAGNVLWLVGVPLPAMSLIESGKLIPAFIVGRERVKQLPNVPTLAELGFPQIQDERTVLFAMAPAGTPKAVLDRLNAAYNQARADAELQERLSKLVFNVPAQPMSLDAARAAAARQIDAWDNAAKKSMGK